MKIEDFKDLEKLVKLCRKLGVDNITVDGVSLILGSQPLVTSSKKTRVNSETSIPGVYIQDPSIQTDGLTDEQLMFYSADVADPTFGNQ